MNIQIDPHKFGKVAVLMGGLSSEREISLISGSAVVSALQGLQFDVHAIDVGNDIVQRLLEGKYDRAFIALHGPGGEDGVIQGMLETLKIPYTGSAVAASALAMDKQRSKWLWQALHIPTPPFMLVDETTKVEDVLKKLQLPLAVKPVSQGSTLGVTKVVSKDQFAKAVVLARTYEERVMVEPWIEGRELTVGILDNQALPSIRIVPPEFYDYEAKYFSDLTEYHCPSGLSPEEETKLQELALAAYRSIGCRHWGRVDMMQDKEGQFWLLEVNTIPGLTDHSLVPKAAKSIGISFPELLVRILAQTL